MILAKTEMTRMPERCGDCQFGASCPNHVGCSFTGTVVKSKDPRSPDCPLVDADGFMGDLGLDNTLKYRGYTAAFSFSAEDMCFFGMLIGIKDAVMFDATSVDGLLEEFHISTDLYIESCKEIGKEVAPEKEDTP